MTFFVFFQFESFAEEKNYHKELITDWSRIFPDKNRNAAGPKFFKYIIDKKITYKEFIEFMITPAILSNETYIANFGGQWWLNTNDKYISPELYQIKQKT